MQRTDEVRPDLPVPPAPKAPKKKGKALKIVGIIVGGFIGLSAISAALPKPEEGRSAAPPVETPADTTNGHDSPSVDEPATPTEPTKPEPTTAPEIIEPEFTAGQENAISAAESYLDFTAFSKSGLIDQLEFEKYLEVGAVGTLSASGIVATSHRVAVFCKPGLWNYPNAQQVRLVDFRSDAYRVQAFYVCDAGRIASGPWEQHRATVWTHAPTLAKDAAAHIAFRKWNNGQPIYRTLSNGF